MSGGESWTDRGIIPRVFTELFSLIEMRQGQAFNVYASYFEIYNERAYDLLDRSHAHKSFEKWKEITLFED